MSHRRIGFWAVLGVLSAQGAIPAQAATSAQAATGVQIAFNWKAEPEFGGFYAAEIGELFKRQGLKVDLVEGGAGTPVVQMIASGKFAYGIVEGDEIIISQDRGSDVIALFAVYQTSPQGVMIRESRNLNSLKEVFESPGVLALNSGSTGAVYMKHKYPTSKAQIVPYLGGIGNFLHDETYAQQCYVTSEPLAAAAKGVKAKSFLFSESGFHPYITILATRRSYLDQHPEEVKKLVAAVKEGWQAYLKNPEPANIVMNRLNPSMDRKTFQSIAELQKPYVLTAESKKHGLGWMDAKRWQELTDQLLEIKLIRSKKEATSYFLNP